MDLGVRCNHVSGEPVYKQSEGDSLRSSHKKEEEIHV